MDKLSSILAGVPWVGGRLSDAVRSMAHAISNAAGTLENGIDAIVGAAWHALARYLDNLWSQVAAHSAIFVQLAHLVGRLLHAQAGLRAIEHGLTGAAHGVRGLV